MADSIRTQVQDLRDEMAAICQELKDHGVVAVPLGIDVVVDPHQLLAVLQKTNP